VKGDGKSPQGLPAVAGCCLNVSYDVMAFSLLDSKLFLNHCTIPPKSVLTTQDDDTKYRYLGFSEYLDKVTERPYVYIEQIAPEKCAWKKELFDSRKYRSVEPVVDQSVDKPCASDLISQLYTLCCNQTIRGIPLIHLFNYLSYSTGSELQVAIVGGAVRDLLREVDSGEISDIDIAVSGCGYDSLVQYILDFFASRGETLNAAVIRAEGLARRFGMIKVMKGKSDADDLDIGILKAGLVAETNEHKQSEYKYIFGGSWVMDAAMRDYTINAIYVDVCNKIIYDPTRALAMDHVKNKATGVLTITQQLVSAPARIHSLYPALLPACEAELMFELDIGGQFRFYKELAKAKVTEYYSFSDGDVKKIVKIEAADTLKKKIGDSLSSVIIATKDEETFPEEARQAQEKWSRKMTRKLFSFNPEDELKGEAAILDKVKKMKNIVHPNVWKKMCDAATQALLHHEYSIYVNPARCSDVKMLQVFSLIQKAGFALEEENEQEIQ
jgi:hypothetical protein